MMLDGVERLIREYRMLPPGSRVLCAVSGGADSICMLMSLYRLRETLGIELAAAHYNHQLRGPYSDRDEAFVRQFVSLCCEDTAVYTGRGDVAGEAKRLGRGLEETAREMRYAFLRQTAREAGADYIATAHTADDNVETVLMHMARGSGLRGIGGIQPVRGDVVRPMLTTTRREIEDYLRFYGLPYMEDHTNSDVAFARNRIRHQVTPVLEELYPSFCTRMADTAQRLRRDEECLTALARERAEQAAVEREELVIPVKAVADAPEAVAVRVVRELIAMVNGGDRNCAARHLEAVAALCRREAPSGQVSLPYGLTARREYDSLRLLRQGGEVPLRELEISQAGSYTTGMWQIRCECVTYQGERQGPYGFWLKQRPIQIRARQTGDRLKLAGRPGKSVKKWLVEEKLPRHIRDGLPVFWMEGRLAAVTGLGAAEDAAPKAGETAWNIVIKPEKREE